MSKRSDGLISDSLDSRWSVTHAPAAGATVAATTASAVPNNGHYTNMLETLSYTIKNMAAAAHTVTTAVREHSVAGTVLASWDDIVAAGTTGGRHLPDLRLQAAKGKEIVITQDTLLASVKATVNMTGWTDTNSDY